MLFLKPEFNVNLHLIGTYTLLYDGNFGQTATTIMVASSGPREEGLGDGSIKYFVVHVEVFHVSTCFQLHIFQLF